MLVSIALSQPFPPAGHPSIHPSITLPTALGLWLWSEGPAVPHGHDEANWSVLPGSWDIETRNNPPHMTPSLPRVPMKGEKEDSNPERSGVRRVGRAVS